MQRLIIVAAWAVCWGADLVAETPLDQTRYQPFVAESHATFSLPSIQDRQPITLSSFRGKKLLLLHFASW